MTQDEFNSAIAILIASVGRPMPDEQVRAWKLICDDLTAEQLRRGVITTIRTHEFAGFPPIAAIRKNAIGKEAGQLTIADRAVVAWGAIKRAVAVHGGYATVQFDDPLVTASVRELGGWSRFCDCEAGEKFDVWLRKDFERTYSALLVAGTSAERTAPLAGLCDVANSANGHHERLQATTINTGLSPVPARLVRGEVPRIERSEVRRIAHDCVSSLGLPVDESSIEPASHRSRDEQVRILRERIAQTHEVSVDQ